MSIVNLVTFEFKNSKKCCMAPYSTINFDTNGHIRVCCYNNIFILGQYPHTSIKDAWNNKERKEFIEQLKNKNFKNGCNLCKSQIIQGNMENALFSGFDYYDNFKNDEDIPICFNFDFGNICNYECMMCGGKWSSSIRKNREKLPPIISPYDDKFVEQLKEYIPTMKVAKFLGGEPFLNSIYYKIWDLMAEHNKFIDISITSNGSIFNSRIKNYFEKLPNLKMIVSLDSLDENTYQFIRKNGNFKNVMNNIEEFKKYGCMSGIAFCPMIQNVHETPHIIQYCIDNDFAFGMNYVHMPLGGKIKGIHEGEKYNTKVWVGGSNNFEEVNVDNKELIPEFCLENLPKKELSEVIDYLKQFSFKKHSIINSKYKSFIASLEYYLNKSI